MSVYLVRHCLRENFFSDVTIKLSVISVWLELGLIPTPNADIEECDDHDWFKLLVMHCLSWIDPPGQGADRT